MHIEFVLAGGALVCAGVSDFVYRRAALAGVAAHDLMLVQSSSYGVLVLLFGIMTHTLQFDHGALWGALAGVFAFTGYYSFARSVQAGAVSRHAAVFRLNFVVTAVLAIVFLGETLSLLKLLGMAFALLAAWLLIAARGATSLAGAPAPRAALPRVLIATTAVGIASLIYKIGMRAGSTAAGLLVSQACVVIGLSMLTCLRQRGHIRPSLRAVPFGLMTAVLLACAFTLLILALATGEASVIVPMSQMGFVVTALLGVVFLREPVDRQAVIGFACAMAALACLAAG